MSNSTPSTSISTTPTQFAHTLTKITVAQILKFTGFKSSTSSALETLTRVAALFIHHISSSAAALSPNPSLHHLFAAIQNLDFPLDFSPLPLSRCSSHCPPFPRRVPKSDPSLPQPAVKAGGSLVARGRDIPQWLPGFPIIKNDCDDGGDGSDVGGGRKTEVYWEERRAESVEVSSSTAVAGVKEKGTVSRKRKRKGDLVVFGRRERVKFRIGSVKKAKTENVDDMELRTGVCRGGKRISLVKRHNLNCRF